MVSGEIPLDLPEKVRKSHEPVASKLQFNE